MKISGIAVVVSFAWLLVSFWNRNEIPGNVDFVPELAEAPIQTETGKQPFNATYNDVNYLVEPEFDYVLHGMVVSFRHHDGKSRMHFQANDHLNMLDVCVVWGDNAKSEHLDEFSFWNGIFTCRYETSDGEAWAAFDETQISNNHLISDNEYIRDRVRNVSIGDQIRVRGFLASYGDPEVGKRGTSTTRTDTGNGACETIYVEDFRIVKAATSYWRISMWLALAALVASLAVYLRQPHRAWED